MDTGSKLNEKQIYTKDIWIKSYAKGVNYDIDIKERTVLEMLYDAANKYPNNTALIFEGYKLTYAQLIEMIDKLATALVEMGVKKVIELQLYCLTLYIRLLAIMPYKGLMQ